MKAMALRGPVCQSGGSSCPGLPLTAALRNQSLGICCQILFFKKSQNLNFYMKFLTFQCWQVNYFKKYIKREMKKHGQFWRLLVGNSLSSDALMVIWVVPLCRNMSDKVDDETTLID